MLLNGIIFNLISMINLREVRGMLAAVLCLRLPFLFLVIFMTWQICTPSYSAPRSSLRHHVQLNDSTPSQ